MPTPRALILRAPGTNCDLETEFAFRQAGAQTQRVHVNQLLEQTQLLREYQICCLPGGFSYGDDIAAGRILACQIQHHLQSALREFQQAGKLILGICNGFQVLIKAGLLLPPDEHGPLATLSWNDSGCFEDRWVQLQAAAGRCVFLEGIDRLYLPVAHAEGKFVARSPAVLEQLEQAGRFVLSYAWNSPGDSSGREQPASERGLLPFPHNPNGSQANVAGICDESGRVFGLMPHPERHIDPTHHPQWTRLPGERAGDGLQIFQNAVRYFSGC